MFNYTKLIFAGIAVFSNFIPCFSQNMEIEGVWFNERNCFLEIINEKKRCSISNGSNFFVLGYGPYTINNDTLSIFDGIYNPQHELQFKLKLSSKTQLELLPINNESKTFLDKDTLLVLTKQGFIIDNSIDFEEITYHISTCEGPCQAIHIRINAKGEVFLVREPLFEDRKKGLKAGYFYGKLKKVELKELKQLLTQCNLRNLNFDNLYFVNASVTVLVIYFNGTKKYLKSDNPPPITASLTNYLNYINQHTIFRESNKKFEFEGLDDFKF